MLMTQGRQKHVGWITFFLIILLLVSNLKSNETWLAHARENPFYWRKFRPLHPYQVSSDSDFDTCRAFIVTPPNKGISVTRNLVKDLIARIESGDRSSPQTPKTDYRRAYSTPNQKVTVEADMVKARVQQFMKVQPKTTETAQPAPTKRLSLPARNENFVSLRKNFEIKQSETIELNESEDEELIEFNFSQIVAKLMMEANYDEVDEDLDVAFSSAVESVYIFDNKQQTNKINYKEELHEGHYHVNNYEIITTEAVDFDPPAGNAPQKDALPDDPINAMIRSDCQTALCKGDVLDLHKSNRINMNESTVKIEEKFEEILCQYGIVDSARSKANKEVLEEVVNEIVNSNEDSETKVEFKDYKDTEAGKIEIIANIKEENVEKIGYHKHKETELGHQAHEKSENNQISIGTYGDSAIQSEDVDNLPEIESILSLQLSAKQVPENLDLQADKDEEWTKLPITDIVRRFEGKDDVCKITRSSLENTGVNVSRYDPPFLAEEIPSSNEDNIETKVEIENTKDIEAVRIETSNNFKKENVEEIELEMWAHEKVEDDYILIGTKSCDDFVIQNEDIDSPFKLKSILSEELSAEELETIPENKDLGYDNLEADEDEESAQLSVADIINRFENKSDGCQMKRSSLGHVIRNVSYYDPALLAKEILEEIINKTAWLNEDFETQLEFRDTKDVEAIKMETTNKFNEESVEKIQLEDQVYETPEDGRISIEIRDNCVIQNGDVENLSKIKSISSEKLSQVETVQENLDLDCENLEADESQQCAKPSIADLIKRFESKNDDCKAKRSSLGDIRTNSAYFSNRGKRRSSSADIKWDRGDGNQDDFQNREIDNNDNETVKLSVKELKNIFDRRKEEQYQNINHLRKKLVYNEAITYAPKILDDVILEERTEVEDKFKIVEFEENEIEKRHKELVRFYQDLFEDIGNPLFIIMGIYCAIYLAVNFVKLLLYICYKMLG